ncbi:hypothetical protein ElyMa_002112500 [Elysia marginata]|uniref:CTNNB1 binding N-teminal domain-containing protein n=1 Tax=Elysia marginata TaxID=1093978 RepID=A0AAV4FG20_9GAST|nr:hypothetical protein ElyMa_002112500 [Elysia marginata]
MAKGVLDLDMPQTIDSDLEQSEEIEPEVLLGIEGEVDDVGGEDQVLEGQGGLTDCLRLSRQGQRTLPMYTYLMKVTMISQIPAQAALQQTAVYSSHLKMSALYVRCAWMIQDK